MSYLGLGVVERQHAVVVAVLRLDVGAVGGGRAAELAELRHGVPVPGVHVGGRGRRVVVRVEHVGGAVVVGMGVVVKDFGPAPRGCGSLFSKEEKNVWSNLEQWWLLSLSKSNGFKTNLKRAIHPWTRWSTAT